MDFETWLGKDNALGIDISRLAPRDFFVGLGERFDKSVKIKK